MAGGGNVIFPFKMSIYQVNYVRDYFLTWIAVAEGYYNLIGASIGYGLLRLYDLQKNVLLSNINNP